jgi:hypothetical protein
MAISYQWPYAFINFNYLQLAENFNLYIEVTAWITYMSNRHLT